MRYARRKEFDNGGEVAKTQDISPMVSDTTPKTK